MKYLSHYTQAAQTELLNKTGTFFAFSTKQLEEQKQEGVKYTLFESSGMFVPTANKEELVKGLERINQEGIKKDVEENGPEAIISREYFNYECQIVCDTTDAREQLKQYQELYPELFTEEKLKETFKKCYSRAIEQNLF